MHRPTSTIGAEPETGPRPPRPPPPAGRGGGSRSESLGRRWLGGGPLPPLLLLLGLMLALEPVRSAVPHEELRPAATTVALGFLLLAAVLAGALTHRYGLPRITGYIIAGILVGPDVLAMVTAEDVASLRLIDDIAISLIALSAGAELKVRDLRARGRSMASIMTLEMTTVFVVVGGAVLLMAPLLPFTAGRDAATIVVIALIFGSIAIANSPSVAIAVINDTRSRGPVASTILGVTVMKDVAVILLFAVALSVARTVLQPGGGFDVAFLTELGWELGGSVLIGALSGWVIAQYLRRLRAQLVLFALALAFVNAYVASILHLELLILSLTAGFFLENIAPARAEPFVEALEANSLPLYALFFSLAGASLHLGELATLWPFALVLVSLRAAAIFGGTWMGARVSDAEPAVRRYAWLGFISQAGVTLGMVVIAARAFPTWGEELMTLFVAMVAIHELVGPVLLQAGLQRAGEVGRRDGGEPSEPSGHDGSALATSSRG